jgi:hypothetical protein
MSSERVAWERAVWPRGRIFAFTCGLGRAKLLSIAIVFGSLSTPLSSLAETLILNCTYAEVLTGTNGAVKNYSVMETIKVGSGVYQVWSSKDRAWGENQCNRGRCTSNAEIFSYDLSDINSYDGYVLADTEQLTIRHATGRLVAEKKTSTTTPLTGYQAETTWYDDGTCMKGTDPATASTKKL